MLAYIVSGGGKKQFIHDFHMPNATALYSLFNVIGHNIKTKYRNILKMDVCCENLDPKTDKWGLG